VTLSGTVMRFSSVLIGGTCIALLLLIRRRHGVRLREYVRNRASVRFFYFRMPSLDFFLLALPITLCTCGLLVAGLVLGSPLRLVPRSHPTATLVLAALLAGAALLTSLLLTPATMRRLTPALQSTLGEALSIACLVSAHIGLLSVVVISYLALYPWFQVTPRPYHWEFLDKRWLIATYAFAVATLVVLPLVLYRLFQLSGGAPSAMIDTASSDPSPSENRPSDRTRALLVPGLRLAVAFVLAVLLATYYFHPYFLRADQRKLIDSHELVHLGSLLRISQGHAPFTEAETQYGPGHQVLTHWLMERTEFSLYGFRMSHLLFNFVAAVVIYSIFLSAFPWYLGVLFVLFSLWVSPLHLFDFYGWGVVARWTGPFVLAACLPAIFRRGRGARRFPIGVFLLGLASGFLSWVASEGFSGGLLTYSLTIILFWSVHGVSLRTVARLSLAFGLGFVATWVIVFTWVHDVSQIQKFLYLYFHRTRLMTAGYTNSAWSSGVTNPWHLPYIVTPYLYIAFGAAFLLWIKRPAAHEREWVARLQFTAMWVAAVVLYLPVMLRADFSHFLTGSLPLGAILVLAGTTLPSLLTASRLRREAVRAWMIVFIVLVYPGPKSLPELVVRAAGPGLGHVADTAGVAGFFIGGRARDPGPEDRLGFEPDASRCCSENKWTYREWSETVVHAFGGTVAAAVYFFADLRVGTSITEPVMTILTESDMRRWKADIERSAVSCLVTTDPSAAFVRDVLARFERYSTHERQEPVPYTIYCRE
jgi:hypothetical protein